MAARSQPFKDPWKEQRLFLSRIIGAGVMVAVLTALLVWRLVDLQIVGYQRFSDLAKGNQIDIQSVPPTRGLIYDRNGKVLAKNQPSWQLVAVPEDVTDLEGSFDALEALELLDPADRPVLLDRVRSQPRWQPVLLANLDEYQAATFAARSYRFQGIELQAGLIRYYPYGEAAAHTVGYVSSISSSDYEKIDRRNYAGTLQIGKTGIERYYEDQLHGTVGLRPRVVDAHNRPTDQSVPDGYIQTLPPVPGEHVILSLDIDLQLAAEYALDGRRGAVVAIDPRNGDVLTFVSMPAFDPNSFATGMSAAEYSMLSTDPYKPFLPRAMISDRYYPGSTIKPFLGLAALHYDLDYVNEHHVCTGEFRLPGSSKVWNEGARVIPHGDMDLHSAIVRSCNIYFYGLGDALGIDRISAFLGRFGFGSKTGIDIGGEASGLLPSREWKKSAFRNREDQNWYRGETINLAIGQGYFEVTPLQLAHATATLAARGKRFQPRLLTQTEDPLTGARQAIDPVELEAIGDVDPVAWDFIHGAMLGVTTELHGTGATAMKGTSYSVAGKSGTAQGISIQKNTVYDAEAIDERDRDNGLFIAFAPVENPEIAVAVLVENLEKGGGGSQAAPVARAVMDAYFGNSDYVAQLVTN
jgi:penicillin-binding protein 2